MNSTDYNDRVCSSFKTDFFWFSRIFCFLTHDSSLRELPCLSHSYLHSYFLHYFVQLKAPSNYMILVYFTLSTIFKCKDILLFSITTYVPVSFRRALVFWNRCFSFSLYGPLYCGRIPKSTEIKVCP